MAHLAAETCDVRQWSSHSLQNNTFS